MKLLALDPASTTGIAFGDDAAEAPTHWDTWAITHPADSHPGRRLVRLRELIYAAHRTWRIDRIAFEESSFGSPNPNVQAMHNEHRGVIKLCASELGIPITPANIATVKAFAGGGRFGKAEMIAALEARLGIRTTSGDVADACWIWAWAKAHPNGAPTAKQKKRVVKARRKKAPRLF